MQTKDILKDLRKSKGYTSMKDFCDIADINFSTYQNYETGKRIPTADILIKLADFYGVTTDYLLGREEQKNPLANLNVTVDDDKFIELYSTLPEYAKQIFVEVMSKLAEASKGQKQVITENTTAGELEEKAKAQAQEQDAG